MSQLEQMSKNVHVYNDIWLTPKYLGALENSKGKERFFAGATSKENSLEATRTNNKLSLHLVSLSGFEPDWCGVLLPLHQHFK